MIKTVYVENSKMDINAWTVTNCTIYGARNVEKYWMVKLTTKLILTSYCGKALSREWGFYPLYMLYDSFSSKSNGEAQIILLNKLKIFSKLLILDELITIVRDSHSHSCPHWICIIKHGCIFVIMNTKKMKQSFFAALITKDEEYKL